MAHKSGAGKSVVGDTKLSCAVDLLKQQHPIKHDDHGPHHSGSAHVTHVPLHGLKPTAGY